MRTATLHRYVVLAALVCAAPGAARAQTRGLSHKFGAQVYAAGSSLGGWGTPYASTSGAGLHGSASASADMPIGILRASAASSHTVPSDVCRFIYDTCEWSVMASADIWDIVTIRRGSAVANSALTWSYSMDGSVSRGPYGGFGSGIASYYFGTSEDSWYNPSYVELNRSKLGKDSVRVSGSLGLSDAPITLYYFAGLHASAYNSATADYGSTMRFTWSIPEGAIVTSASGAFVAPTVVPRVTATPEPASVVLLAVGLAGLGGLRRRHGQGRLYS